MLLQLSLRQVEQKINDNFDEENADKMKWNLADDYEINLKQ